MGSRKTENKAASSVIVIERCVQSMLAWMYLVTIFHDGVPYDYLFEVGPVTMSEESAKALVRRNGYLLKARGHFLAEVPLGSEVNDVELQTA